MSPVDIQSWKGEDRGHMVVRMDYDMMSAFVARCEEAIAGNAPFHLVRPDNMQHIEQWIGYLTMASIEKPKGIGMIVSKSGTVAMVPEGLLED